MTDAIRVPKETTIEVVANDELHTFKPGAAIKPDDPGAEAATRMVEALHARAETPAPEPPTSAPEAGEKETDR